MKSAGTPLTSQLLLPGGTASWTSRYLLTDAASPAEPFAFRNIQLAQQIAQRKVHKRTKVRLSVSPESLCSSKRISASHKEEFFFLSKYNLDLLSFYGSMTHRGKNIHGNKMKGLSDKIYSTRVEVKHL